MNHTASTCIVSQYVSIFNDLLKTYGFSQHEVARRSGLNQPTISRFCTGRDVMSSSYFQIISAMPFEFQRDYWGRLLKDVMESDQDCFMRISNASRSEMKQFVLALAERFLEVEKSND